jgi:DNA-binding NtrC family response regulator/pSer/pThr/pTyr-binding forkhead associated (FHA) protein
MKIRIHAHDLPARTTEDVPLYRLAWRVGRKQRSHPLGEGEVVVGASPKSDISIEAAGVRSRHLRLKRHGDDVYVQSLGRARVLVNAEPIEGLVRLPLGEPFAFGAVTAVVERVSVQDQRPAVQIQPTSGSPAAEDGEAQVSASAVERLRRLNEALERIAHTPDNSVLMEALRDCLAPVAAALFRRHDRGEWTPLAELKAPGAALATQPDETEDCSRFTAVAGKHEYLLLVQFSSETNEAWQHEFCRHILLQASLHDRNWLTAAAASGGEAQSQPDGGASDDAWRDFVGSGIRARLSASTDICRYSDTVLVLGETGTGKELASLALHRLWGRSGSLVAINCAAIPGELLDAELFGIEAGAATGVTARAGRIREAEGGTLFLDEISELPSHLQSKLLRVLQEREYFSVGGTRLQRADVKIIAASNQSAAYLQSEHMRQDLYFRLSQATLTLPPLREAPEDLAALCAHFLGLLERQCGRGIKGLSVSALDKLKAWSWPGNVRELQNLLRYLYAAAAPGGLIQSGVLPAEVGKASPLPREGKLAAVVEAAEREAIRNALLQHRNTRDAARALGLSEGYLYRKLKKLGLAGRARPANRERTP